MSIYKKINFIYSTPSKNNGSVFAKTSYTTAINMCESWDDFVSKVMDVSQWQVMENAGEKSNLMMMILGEVLKSGGRRTNDNIKERSGLVLDYDDTAMSFEDIQNDLKDWEFVLYSSPSYGIKEGNRCRIIVPFEQDMTSEEWQKYRKSFIARFPYIDSSCFTLSQGQNINAHLQGVEPYVYYNSTGKFLNPIEDIEYFEDGGIEDITRGVNFEDAQFTDNEFQELAKAIIDHQAGQLGYEERRILANRLKCIGMNEFDAVQLLDRVSKPGFSTPNKDLVRNANPTYAHPEGLYKNIAKGVRIAALERRIVRSVASDTVLEVPKSKYDGEWTLDSKKYLSDIFNFMDFSTGINLLISDVATGKSSTFMINGKAVPGVMVLAPLSSIVESFKGDNNLSGSGIGTWNQIESILREKDKSKFKDITLVVDECHGLFEDYGYKSKLINRLIDSFKYFKAVILMSGTVEAENFSSITFNKVYRVHKPSQATKNIRTMLCTKKDDVVIDHINKLKNKTIVLMNNKDLCEVVQTRISRSSLIVNADVKKTPEVQNFFKNRSIGNYDVIIGTNSIVEGLSIEDKLTDVDVVIWDDLVPERIEQFTNRFRNVSGTKNVWYFIDRKPVEEVEDYRREEVLKDARTLCDSLQGLYEGISTDSLRRSFVRQFSGDMYQDLVFIHDGKFNVSFTGIDYEYAQYRASQFRNDFAALSKRLISFGFNVFYPIIVDGNEKSAVQIKEEKQVITEARIKERESILESLITDIEGNTVKCDSDAPELYTATYGSIQKLLAKGLDKRDVSKAITGYIDDESFFALAHADADYVETGETIRELIISEVNGRTELQAHETQDIADKVIGKVLTEYFAGDAKAMCDSRSWGGLVSCGNTYSTNDLNKRDPYVLPQTKSDACSTNDLNKEISKRHFLQTKSSKAAKEILNKYIRLGKGKSKTVKGVSVRVAPIEALNHTGLHFNKVEVPNFSNPMMHSIMQKAQNLPSNQPMSEPVVVMVVNQPEPASTALPESAQKLRNLVKLRKVI